MVGVKSLHIPKSEVSFISQIVLQFLIDFRESFVNLAKKIVLINKIQFLKTKTISKIYENNV